MSIFKYAFKEHLFPSNIILTIQFSYSTKCIATQSILLYKLGTIDIVQMFKNSFWYSRSLSWDKDLLLHVNPYETLKNVHTKPTLYLPSQLLGNYIDTFLLVQGVTSSILWKSQNSLFFKCTSSI